MKVSFTAGITDATRAIILSVKDQTKNKHINLVDNSFSGSWAKVQLPVPHVAFLFPTFPTIELA